jgi:hypothetical protein
MEYHPEFTLGWYILFNGMLKVIFNEAEKE